MTTCAKIIPMFLLAALVVAMPVATALGAPFAYVTMLGRVSGGSGEYSSVVGVKPGEVVEYEMFVRMAGPLPITNISDTPNKTMSSLLPDGLNGNGVNALKFHIYEASTQAIKLALDGPVTLAPAWTLGTGAVGGYLPNTVGFNYSLPVGYWTTLRNVRPFQANATYAGSSGDSLVGTGTAHVDAAISPTAADSDLKMGYHTSTTAYGQHGAPWYIGALPSGASTDYTISIRMNGAVSFQGKVNSADPYLGFNNLHLYTRYAMADAKVGDTTDIYEQDYNLGGTMLAGGGTVGTHATVAKYQWDIGNGMRSQETPTASLSLTQEELQDLWNAWGDKVLIGGKMVAQIPIKLIVTASDGEISGGTGGGRLDIIPEPATLTLLGLGLAGLISRRRRQ